MITLLAATLGPRTDMAQITQHKEIATKIGECGRPLLAILVFAEI